MIRFTDDLKDAIIPDIPIMQADQRHSSYDNDNLRRTRPHMSTTQTAKDVLWAGQI